MFFCDIFHQELNYVGGLNKEFLSKSHNPEIYLYNLLHECVTLRNGGVDVFKFVLRKERYYIYIKSRKVGILL